MEPDVNVPFEVEQVIPDDLSSTVPTTPWQTIAYIGGLVLTTLATWGGIVLKRKRPKDGAQDAVFEINRVTIEDQRTQIKALQAENDTLRQARSEFEAASTMANANLKIARQAAEAAVKAAEATAAELEALRPKWIKAQQYIHELRTTLARHGLEIPPEPS